jgi:NADPH-dependent curcumin reductase CurA
MQEYAAIPADWARPIEVRTKLTHHLGVLGITGLTAWFGLLRVVPPVPGDTVVISSAAGAVGHIAGQLARIAGARVVALTSSDEKNGFLQRELGFEAAVNIAARASPRISRRRAHTGSTSSSTSSAARYSRSCSP